LDDWWRGVLGTNQAQRYERTTLAIIAHGVSANPEVQDNEDRAHRQRALSVLYGLFLTRVFQYERALALTGANEGGDIRVRQVSYLEPHYLPNRVRPDPVELATVQLASQAAAGIRTVHDPVVASFERLRRGFHAWMRGMQERYGDERLHQFVRSVEAVIKPDQGRTRRQFVSRGQVFAGNIPQSQTLLGQLFDFRSAAEHMHSIASLLHERPEAERETAALRLAYQAQLLAGHVYVRILSDPALLARFQTDADIEAFWRQPWATRVRIWGAPIDLDTVAAARFA